MERPSLFLVSKPVTLLALGTRFIRTVNLTRPSKVKSSEWIILVVSSAVGGASVSIRCHATDALINASATYVNRIRCTFVKTKHRATALHQMTGGLVIAALGISTKEDINS
jgi:hypothetical protein